MNSNWSYSPETKSWVVTSVTLTFDLWPWPFAWTLPWSNVITPENFMMIRWWEHSQKGVTDGQTDGRTENTIHRAAWSQLKTFPTILTKISQKTLSFTLDGLPYNTDTIYLIYMMTSSNGNIFRVTGPLCGEFTGQRWIPRTKASNAELWCFLWSASE